MPEGRKDTIHSISYGDLSNPTKDVFATIKAAFGPHGAGIIVIENVPRYPKARRELLPLIRQFAKMPAATLEKYELIDCGYQFGWSHGKEILENGQLDVAKGSFYANPLGDENIVEESDAFLSACNNVWPTKEIPTLERKFKELSTIMRDTAVKLAALCDMYVAAEGAHPSAKLESVVKTTVGPKGRLLYYFPQSERKENAKWCGWHCDHGSLTCLTKAMYFDEISGQEVENPGDDLAIETRENHIVRVSIPKDAIAFQVGQAAQIHSGGLLKATPHCVTYSERPHLSRATYALFLQPEPSIPMMPPKGIQAGPLPNQYKPGMKFTDFTKATVDQVYNIRPRL
mmetsp:Transcript_2441/g.4866  ORF Transcript_2441/g.4866 Transcript_2441/m.4866 type:complete len:343 (+) Transcript_2441:2377-3405(+)|eukprot:CAMPEP_0203761878 /NCGR_PEP_ID=MMETSP0098-20131031/14875_1 /ASSEMBLY_ACC=CAM_ASM_000208 /TAXON_ID=96639 /ORGANISM=" , Strain NY0313808BC1" /LENGTH=342 /DNA_ID=CAMNT_0050656047 /DNA_START=248 /DNA_END=1276 /DNA_ORIENTATION=-